VDSDNPRYSRGICTCTDSYGWQEFLVMELLSQVPDSMNSAILSNAINLFTLLQLMTLRKTFSWPHMQKWL